MAIDFSKPKKTSGTKSTSTKSTGRIDFSRPKVAKKEQEKPRFSYNAPMQDSFATREMKKEQALKDETFKRKQTKYVPPKPKSKNEQLGEKLRDVPVLGGVYKGLDWLQKKTEPAAKVAQELYTPGAGLGALASAEKAGAQLFTKYAPSFPNVVSKAISVSPKSTYIAAKTAPLVPRIASEAVLGGYAGAGQSLAAHPEKGFRGAAEGATTGALLGGATPIAGKAIISAAKKTGVTPLLRKTGQAILNKYRPKEVQAEVPTETLALPLGRADAARRTPSPSEGVIVPEYQFKLPMGTDRKRAHIAEAANDLKSIDEEIRQLNQKYEAAVIDEYNYLKSTMKQGVKQGGLHFDVNDVAGDKVVGRTGRQSNNQWWYRQFYADKGRAPSNKELHILARQRVENGFELDEFGNMAPSWTEENAFHDTLSALADVKQQLTKSLNELESPLNLTDAQLKKSEYKYQPTATQEPQPVRPPQAPKQKVEVPQQAEPRKAAEVPQQEKKVDHPRIAEIDNDFKKYKESIQNSVKNGVRTQEEANRQIKGKAMRNAAEKREIIQGDSLVHVDGGLTDKELANKVGKLKTNYAGKEVIADGKPGTVTKMSFGKVGVKFADGKEKFFDADDIKPAKDIEETIRKQEAQKKEPEKEEPNQEPIKQEQKQEAPKQEVAKQEPKKETVKPPSDEGVRSTFETLRKSGALKDETVEEINKLKQTYDIAHNINTVEDANKLMRNPDEAHEIFKSNALLHNKKNAIHTALAQRLMQHYGNLGQHKKAAEVAEKIAEDLTNQGQGSQAARIINRLTPDGQLILLTRKAQKNGGELSDTDSKNFQEAAHEKLAAMGATTRADAYTDLLDKMDAGHIPTADELKILQSVSERTKKYLPQQEPTTKEPKIPKETKVSKALNVLDKEAKAARERLKASRNIGILPGRGNAFVDSVIIVADGIAKGVINSKNYVGEIVREFGEQARPQAKKIYNAAKARISSNPDLKHLKEQSEVLDDMIKKFERNVAPSAEDLNKVKSLANDIKGLEGKTAQDKDIEMQKIFSKYNKSSINDKISAFRYLMMLGSESTQLLNIIPTATLQPLTDFFGNAVATAIDTAMSKAVKGRVRTRSTKGANPLTWYRDYAKNFYKGARYNWQGLNPAGLETADEVRGLALNGPILKYGTVGILPTYERAVKALSGGADYAVYQTVYDRELMRQAFLDAKKKGIKKDVEMQDHMKKFMENPDPDAVEIADRHARRSTYQSEKSVGGAIAKKFSTSKSGTDTAINFMAKAAIPFMRSPINIASTAFSLTPGGLIKGGIKMIYAKTSAQRSEALRELGLGLTGGAGLPYLGYKLHELGVITDENESVKKNVDKLSEQVTGGSFRFNQSAFKRVYEAMMNGGNLKEAGKYREGDETFDYNKLQPIAFPIAVGASFQKQRSEGKGILESAGQAALSGAGSLLSMTAFKGVQDITNTGFNKTPSEEATGMTQRFIESYLKSFSPAILGREARRTDTTQRQAPTGKGFAAIPSNLKGYYQSRTPSYFGGLGIPTSKELPPRVTALGDIKTYPKGYLGSINPLKTQKINYNKAADILYGLIQRTGVTSIAPSAPDKTISGISKETRKETEIELTPKEYAQYQQDVGREITQRIISINDRKELNDDDKVKRIDKAMDDIKKKHANRIRRGKGMKIKK